MVSGNLARTLRYLDTVDAGTGRASRISFYNIAGNEENLRRWEQKLINEWRIVEKFQDDGRDYYRKTMFGEHLHKLLKNHQFLGGLFEELIRDRLRPST